MKLNLAPEADRLSAAAIRRPEGRLGHTVVVLEETGSTNDEARARAAAGAPEGVVILAEAQTRGRGRRNRSWESPPGKNLLASVVLRPGLRVEQGFLVTLSAGVAVAETLAREYRLAPRIKWPNDVLVTGRKVCGILAELHSGGGKINYLILGIGVNLNLAREDLPLELRGVATSVCLETGRVVNRNAFARSLVAELERWYLSVSADGGAEMLSAWHRWAKLRGREVQVGLEQETLRGEALGLDDDGALRLRDRRTGEERRVLAGEVQYFQGGEE